MTLSATDDSASIDLAASSESAEDVGTGSVLLDGLPADSWFAAAIPDLGPTLQRTVDQLSKGGLPGAGMLERQIRETTGIDLRADLLELARRRRAVRRRAPRHRPSRPG